MIRYLFLALVFMASFWFYSMADAQAKRKWAWGTVREYFGYLKSGDTGGILSLLANPFLNKNRKLLEENTLYPEFLREIYRDSNMEIVKVKKIKWRKRVVKVRIYFSPEEPPLKTKFILRRVNGLWKISREISDTNSG